jgi:hypothetical protein
MEKIPQREVRSDELRRNLRPLLNAVEREHAHVTIKRYDEDTAVIVPVGWYRNMLAIKRGVHAFTHDTDGGQIPRDSVLPVGELFSAIGEAAITELEKDR